MRTRNIDVSKLPDFASGHHALGWWGTMGFIAVEGAIFGVLIATYLYGMAGAPQWPPAGEPPPLLWGVVNTGILLVSCWPNQLYKRASEQLDVKGARRWLTFGLLFGAGFLAVRVLEFSALDVRWNTNFYGSIVWAMLGFHALHMLSDFVESTVFAVIAFKKPLTGYRFSDFNDNAVYWYFVVIAWLPIFTLIYIVPRLV